MSLGTYKINKTLDNRRRNPRRLLRDLRLSFTQKGENQTEQDRQDILKINFLLEKLKEYENSNS